MHGRGQELLEGIAGLGDQVDHVVGCDAILVDGEAGDGVRIEGGGERTLHGERHGGEVEGGGERLPAGVAVDAGVFARCGEGGEVVVNVERGGFQVVALVGRVSGNVVDEFEKVLGLVIGGPAKTVDAEGHETRELVGVGIEHGGEEPGDEVDEVSAEGEHHGWVGRGPCDRCDGSIVGHALEGDAPEQRLGVGDRLDLAPLEEVGGRRLVVARAGNGEDHQPADGEHPERGEPAGHRANSTCAALAGQGGAAGQRK